MSVRLAIFTDTHLGYMERDPVVGPDSFVAFDECMQVSSDNHVDAIVHAGDLFDSLAPPKSVFIRTMEIFQKHILGENEDPIEITHWDGLTRPPNTTDDEVKVKIPFFLIHGNHDHPTGFGLTSACELLSTVKYVNYFQKVLDPESVVLKPAVLHRGNIDVVIYGLGSMAEHKFLEALEKNDIRFERPQINPGCRQFNLLLLHQNRPVRSAQQLAVPHMLSQICPWMDLIVWGHEHECRIDIETCCGLKITQPGATIITKMGDFGGAPRSMAILEIDEETTDFQVIRLKTQRPYVYDTLKMGEEMLALSPEQILDCMRMKLEEMIASVDITPPGQEKKLPLLHLHVAVTGLDMTLVNHKQLKYEFSARVANPDQLIDVTRKARPKTRAERERDAEEDAGFEAPKGVEVEQILEKRFTEQPLSFLVADTLNHSLTAYVQNGEKDAFRRNIMELINVRVSKALQLAPSDDTGMTLEEAADFIESLKDDLPLLQASESTPRTVPLSRPSSLLDSSSPPSDIESTPPSQKSQTSRRRKEVIRADEPIPDPVPLRPKRKKK